jgi:hypothetical protein
MSIKCGAGGLYWTSGCDHADVSEFSEYDEFSTPIVKLAKCN